MVKDLISQKICKNCNKTYEGNFCNFCGQSSNVHKINFHYVIHEIQHSIFHVDGGIFYTIKQLFKRPGNSIREFIEGKRVKHFKPVTFVIIASIIHSFLEHYGNQKPFIEDFLTGVSEAFKNNNPNKGLKVLEWLIHHYSYTALLLIPIFSLASYISFKKSKFNYFEHLVLNTYAFGQITIIFILTFPLSYLFPESHFLVYFKLLLTIAFTFWTYFQFFHNLKKSSRIINTIATYSTFLIFIVISLFVLLAMTMI